MTDQYARFAMTASSLDKDRLSIFQACVALTETLGCRSGQP